MKNKRWTYEEIALLKELVIKNCSNKEMGNKLGRSANAVAHALSRYGLSRPIGANQSRYNGMQGKKHTEETKRKIAEKRKRYAMELHPCWKGGKRTTDRGYIEIRKPEHPRARCGYVFEHILVMETMLGRYLEKGELVHHINENRSDNRPQNLMIFKDSNDHNKYHAFMRKEKIFNE